MGWHRLFFQRNPLHNVRDALKEKSVGVGSGVGWFFVNASAEEEEGNSGGWWAGEPFEGLMRHPPHPSGWPVGPVCLAPLG